MWGKRYHLSHHHLGGKRLTRKSYLARPLSGDCPEAGLPTLGSSGIGEEEGTCALSNQQVFKTASPSSTEGNRSRNEGDFCCLFSTLEFSKASFYESVPHTSAVQRGSVTCSRSHSISSVKLRLDPLSESTSHSIFFTAWHCPNVIYQQ